MFSVVHILQTVWYFFIIEKANYLHAQNNICKRFPLIGYSFIGTTIHQGCATKSAISINSQVQFKQYTHYKSKSYDDSLPIN